MAVADTTLERIVEWLRGGRRVAIATLFEAEGSSPFAPGAKLAIDAEGRIEGSVTGGCVESTVAQEALEMLRTGGGPRALRYGISDPLAGSVGLMCGGVVHILLRELGGEEADGLAAVLEASRSGAPAAIATVIDGAGAGESLVAVGEERVQGLARAAALEPHLLADVQGMISQGHSALRRYGEDGSRLDGEVRVFVEVRGTPPKLVLVGGVDFSAALARAASALGFEVTVCDPRRAFTSSSRFSSVAEVVVRWPQDLLAERSLGPRDAVLVFSHDPKLDEPALLSAFATDAGYIGALGSRRTAADRERRLREAGAAEEDLARVHSPCGLDIGARSPEETAISVLAEIVAVHSGRDGGSLRDRQGPIHARH
jgi:xanthine dehydrogenase accessory factor